MSEQIDKCSEMLPLRIITSVLRNIHLQLHHISASVDDVAITKPVRSYSNQNALMTSEVRTLFQSQKAAFQSDDKAGYITTRIPGWAHWIHVKCCYVTSAFHFGVHVHRLHNGYLGRAALPHHLEIWSLAYFNHDTCVVLSKNQPENNLLTVIWTGNQWLTVLMSICVEYVFISYSFMYSYIRIKGRGMSCSNTALNVAYLNTNTQVSCSSLVTRPPQCTQAKRRHHRRLERT